MRRAGRLGWLTAAFALVPAGAAIGYETFVAKAPDWTIPFFAVSMLLAFIAAPLGLASIARVPRPTRAREVDGHLVVDIDGKVVALRPERLRGGALMPGPRGDKWAPGSSVELLLEGGDVLELRVADHDQAEALLQRLGLGSHQRVASLTTSMRLPIGLLVGLWSCIAAVFMVVIGGNFSHLLPDPWWDITVYATGLVMALAMAWLTRRRSIVVGADGLRAGRRFVPYHAIGEIRREPRRIVVVGHDGKAMLRLSGLPDDGYLDAVTHRIDQAMSQATDTDAIDFRRHGRSFEAWRAHVEGVLAQADYRGGHVDPTRALRIACDGQSDVEQRVGAAMALRFAGALDDEGVAKLRIAAEASADPDLHATLEAIAADEIDASALERLVGKPNKPSGRT